jgi:[FeFe] hydrogenase H-cluster maturation GTPase HydF
MQTTPNANRLHIGIFGRRNAGKSSLINSITGQNIALVSDIAGTTADPVYKAMELLPIGPVVIIDTAGIDDVGELGYLRVSKTKEVISKTDIAFLVFPADSPWPLDLTLENQWYEDLKKAGIPIVGILNKCDLSPKSGHAIDDEILECSEIDVESKFAFLKETFPIPFVMTSINDLKTIEELKKVLIENVPFYEKDVLVSDLFNPGEIVLLVAPQDIQAPKGRLILPQVQVMRDVLDHKGLLITVTTDKLADLLGKLKEMPALVVTDSQVFEIVNKILPEDIPLTSFSIVMARYKGDLSAFIEGAKAIGELQDGDRVLIAEACTHHALQGDIGREKLPRWLGEFTGKSLIVEKKTGIDFSKDLSEYKLVIHCGACMFNRKQMMSRVILSKNQNVPITNYGTAIAYMNGILPKVTKGL